MLFNSYSFIFLFLPIVAVLHHLVFVRLGKNAALLWLTFTSIFFYAYWSTQYLWLLAFSLCFNFGAGKILLESKSSIWRQYIVSGAIVVNIGLLAYYKYANFFVSSLQSLTGESWTLEQIILPLGISFFTFEQIAYLVDASRGKAISYTFLEYAFFVLFFPHLIAGPIIKHDDLLNQVRQPLFTQFSWDRINYGLMWFAIGLFKKVILADSIAHNVSPMFQALQAGSIPTTSTAWLGIFAYSLQLYFDFSGYSDMAIGLANMVNLKLPLNFNSPYQASSPIDFWRRWHMTLSRFLKEHLYIPLGGNRSGPWRKHIALLITMLLGGFWHGAGWGFLIWGGLNGLLLSANHLWRYLVKSNPSLPQKPTRWLTSIQITATFVAIMWTRIFFRTNNVSEATTLIHSLLGMQQAQALWASSSTWWDIALCFLAYAWCRWAPNTYQLLAYQDPIRPTTYSIKSTFSLRLNAHTAVLIGFFLALSLLHLNQVSEFLYFQF